MAAKKSKKAAARKAAPPKVSTKKSAAKKSTAKKTPAKKGAANAANAARRPARAPRATRPSKSTVHEIVHWEIQSQNPTMLHKFYSDALDWAIDANNPMQYGMVASKGSGGIDGGIGGHPGSGSRIVVYAAVPTITSTLERIESLGGKTIMPRTDIGPVIMALYEDPEGNVMGLIER